MYRWTEWFAGQSRGTMTIVAAGLVGLIALADYFASNDVSLAVFYVFPIALAAWYVSPNLAHVLSIMSIVLWLAGDFAVGKGWVISGSAVAIWNAVIRLGFYYVITVMLTHIHELTMSLETKVLQRALAL